MDTPGPGMYLALLLLLAFSAFFSASETALSSVNRIRMKNKADDGDKKAQRVLGLSDDYDRTLSAILIGNNLVNIASSSLGSVIVILLAGEQWTWVSTVVLTLLVIIFGETMPKIVAKQNANGIALRNAYIIRALSVILYPVIWLVVGLVHLITRPLRGDTGDGDPEEAASQELQSIIETAEDEDVLDEEGRELLGGKPLGAPEAEQPEGHGGRHDRKRHGVHGRSQGEVADGGHGDGRAQPSCCAGERAGGELAHHLLGVLADVLVH